MKIYLIYNPPSNTNVKISHINIKKEKKSLPWIPHHYPIIGTFLSIRDLKRKGNGRYIDIHPATMIALSVDWN